MVKRITFGESFAKISDTNTLKQLAPIVGNELVAKKLDLKIIEVLKANGFSDNELGTYYYKDVIKAFLIATIEQAIPFENLLEQLASQHSLFYYDITKIKHGDAFQTYFHQHIQESIIHAKGIKRNRNYQSYYIRLTITISEFLIRDLLNEYFSTETLSEDEQAQSITQESNSSSPIVKRKIPTNNRK